MSAVSIGKAVIFPFEASDAVDSVRQAYNLYKTGEEKDFLSYISDSFAVKFLMAGGISLGFLSHLVLDEVYSVERKGVTIRLKKSAGSALKWFGNGLFGNAVAYAILLTMTYITLVDSGVLIPPPQQANPIEKSEPPVQQALPFKTTERL